MHSVESCPYETCLPFQYNFLCVVKGKFRHHSRPDKAECLGPGKAFELCDDSLANSLFCYAATRQSFKEQEALVYQQLAQLIKDAVWLKSYLAAVMRLEQEAFTQAYVALGNTKASPVINPHMDAVHIPSTPVEGGMIPAARPLDSPGQVVPQPKHHVIEYS